MHFRIYRGDMKSLTYDPSQAKLCINGVPITGMPRKDAEMRVAEIITWGLDETKYWVDGFGAYGSRRQAIKELKECYVQEEDPYYTHYRAPNGRVRKLSD